MQKDSQLKYEIQKEISIRLNKKNFLYTLKNEIINEIKRRKKVKFVEKKVPFRFVKVIHTFDIDGVIKKAKILLVLLNYSITNLFNFLTKCEKELDNTEAYLIETVFSKLKSMNCIYQNGHFIFPSKDKEQIFNWLKDNDHFLTEFDADIKNIDENCSKISFIDGIPTFEKISERIFLDYPNSFLMCNKSGYCFCCSQENFNDNLNYDELCDICSVQQLYEKIYDYSFSKKPHDYNFSVSFL